MQLTPEEDAELDGLKARLDAGDLKRGSAEFGRMMTLARRRRDAIAAAHAAAAALLPPPPPPPAPPVPLPDPAKFRARQDRDLRELLDLIRSEIVEALGGQLPAAEPAPYIDASERPAPDVVGGEEDPALASIPAELRGMMVDDETPEKFTERMRRRYRYLKHMQMDASKPTSARALPDMNDEERAEMEDLQARGAEAVAWLERE